MDVFDLRTRLVDDYKDYTNSFINILDDRINRKVDNALEEGALWPESLLQLNPTFFPGESIEELANKNVLHSECAKIFRTGKNENDFIGNKLFLHKHQTDAIYKAKEGKSYVLTSGTGSGKSMAYIVPIVDHVLRSGTGNGVKAIIVYPMNALANSQIEELNKFLNYGYSEDNAPVSFARYTGQELDEERESIRNNPPDILLTNYMMLELMLTRKEDRNVVSSASNLKFLVFDELHTYRGRQGADIAMLIRRCQQAFGNNNIIHVGTSATMSSGGSRKEQKKEVARVAEVLFGIDFDETQVIDETLERATPEVDFSKPEVLSELKSTIAEDADPPGKFDDFRNHPLSSWIESTFGVHTDPDSKELVRNTPQRLRGENSAADQLSKLTDTSSEACYEILRRFLTRGAELHRSKSSRFPIFAFRLHQFFTRGDTVWATIEAENERYLDLSKLGAKPGEPEKPLYPLVFCRHCGKEYYKIKISKDGSDVLLKPNEEFSDDNEPGIEGYLFLDQNAPWPRGEGKTLISRLPSALVEVGKDDKERVNRDYKKNLPEPVFVNPNGKLSNEATGTDAALIYDNFLFCLNSGCGVTYTRSRRSEKGKLSTLGVDNRSTATTILAVRALIELQNDGTLSQEAQKLLSFTDNRQDASLQAGHFNDFTQVALLRSALYKAAESKGNKGLSHAELAESVFNTLILNFEEYAADDDLFGPAKTNTDNALKKVIEYYLYRDLQRGWRVTAPNLEECGMLDFDYEGLTGPDSLLEEQALWEDGIQARDENGKKVRIETPELIKHCAKEIREEFLRELLDMLRQELAIKAGALDPLKQRELVEATSARLRENTVWYLEDSKDLTKSVVAYPRSKPKRAKDKYGLFVSSYGIYGRYLKRTIEREISLTNKPCRDDIDEIINFLFLALRRYGIIEQVRDADGPGYQINHAAMRWLAGTGKSRPIDRRRLLEEGEIPPASNKYFVECYKSFVELKCLLEAREHTAQVISDQREEREERFRKGSELGGLPLLFCSPTMELGVDIAQLNLVNMRNVPPTPANYAQRSGRAGRGGQPALVFTYCAGRSPHDQYYFRQPTQMVAGTVVPPRIDLRNRELLRSHIYAIWMEVTKPDLGKTLTAVLDIKHENGKINLPIKEHVKNALSNQQFRKKTHDRADLIIKGIKDHISDAAWYHDDYVKEMLDQIEISFEDACNRWREMYRSAVRQQELHNKIILDHTRPPDERNHSKRLRLQAEDQMKLLTQAEGIYEGDFYTYRYLAAEGFLPGYNFPRLPLSAYVPARRQRKGRNEFVSRPRFLAITEFGPQALIYHEGAQYKVYKANLDFGSDDVESTHSLVTSTMKRCQSCGYAHLEQGNNLNEVCDRCGASLDGESIIPDLIHLQNVSLRLTQRITCNEEERRRYGYKVFTAYRFPARGNKLDRKDAEVIINGTPVMKLNYGDATALYRINTGWASQKDDQSPGFLLDLEKGYWATNPKDNDDPIDEKSGRLMRVVPYVTDTKNALVMSFEPIRSRGEMFSLQAALKEAIQKYFQLEPRELNTEILPKSDDPKEIIFYEAAEGGAGILRQLVENPKVIPGLAKTALETCHFNPETIEDLEEDSCGKACYRCLLDYGNQSVHQLLDRHMIKNFLLSLTKAECKPSGGTGTRSERLALMRSKCDSKLEIKWLDMLDELKLYPPSDAQYLIESCSTRPDFFYKEHNAAIYIDGPPHDETEQKNKDQQINEMLMEAGFAVIRFHHREDWHAKFSKHPDIFGEIKS